MDSSKSTKYITISIAAFICYCNTLWGTFVFDDSEAIVKNKDVMPHTPILDIFKNDFWGTDISLNSSHKSYRPMTIISFRLNVMYSKNKLDAFPFHATNVILYGILCLLTIPVFELFVKKMKYEDDMDDVAYLSSLLFTVHPVHTEAVACLVGRADILSSILFFTVMLAYTHFAKTNFIVWFLYVFAVTTCAVLCKETAITVLGMCMIFDIYKHKKSRKDWFSLFSYSSLLRYTSLGIIGVIIMYFRFSIMNFEGPTFTSLDNPAAFSDGFLQKVLTFSYVYFLNMLLLIWPEWLCFDWSMGCIPLIETICDIRVVFVVMFWLTVISTLFILIKNTIENGVIDVRFMAVFLIVFPFLPASNLFFKVGFVIAERTLLLPSAGFCLLIGLGFKKIKNNSQKKLFCNCIYFFVCVVFISRCVQRNFEWLTEEKLFTSALKVCPLNGKVHYNVAKIAADKGNRNLALKEYEKAIELHPKYEQAMNNLANLFREDQKYEEAEKLLRKAVDVRPNFAAAWMNLGIVLTSLNNTEEAEHCYKMAISHRKKYPDCYYNLGNLYLDQKRYDEALKAWEMAVLYRPSHVAAWSNTLVLLDSMKKYDEVLELGRTALIYNPKSPALHFSLANTLGKIEQFEKAEGHFLEAIHLSPKNGLYYSNLGVLYHRWNKTEKAREMYKKALQIDPTIRSAEINLKKLISLAQ